MHLKPIAAGLLFTMANGVSNTMQTDSGNDQCIRFRKNSDPRPIDSDHLKVMTYGGRLRFIGANGMKCVKVPGLREILDMCRPNSKGVLGERCHAFYRQYYQILSESDSPPPMLNEENLSKLYIDKISDYERVSARIGFEHGGEDGRYE